MSHPITGWRCLCGHKTTEHWNADPFACQMCPCGGYALSWNPEPLETEESTSTAQLRDELAHLDLRYQNLLQVVESLSRENARLVDQLPPCDGGCWNEGCAMEDCSAHGRTPVELWKQIHAMLDNGATLVPWSSLVTPIPLHTDEELDGDDI